jgi:hypothetical protein
MITESISKSRVTVDTTFKIFNPTWVHDFTHTYQLTLNANVLAIT